MKDMKPSQQKLARVINGFDIEEHHWELDV